MWKFRKSGEATGEGREGGLAGEVAELSAQLRALEGRMKGIEQDWDTQFQKMRRLVGHITKTRAIDEQLHVQPSTPAAVVPPPNGQLPLVPQRRSADEMTRDEIAALSL